MSDTNVKAIKNDIIKQLLLAFGCIALSGVTVLLISVFSDNGIEAFMLSLFAVPVTTFLSSAFSAAILKERDIWLPVMLAAVILGMVYLLGTFSIAYFSFAMLELSGLAGGYFLGVYIGKRRTQN
ncbi:MAG: hypothetical protein ACI4J0_06775 [Huintestinicola sp.]|uniref:hypothetical protein n=1 Tax=Huintestinicola sp. TaxID=2981661 RepID=UPI003F07F974